MAAVEQQIPNLLGGISQQPDPLKLPGQVKKAENVQLDPTFGAMKRVGTEVITALGGIPGNAKWFPILRDQFEHYYVSLYQRDDGIRGYQTFNLQNEDSSTITSSWTNSAMEYLGQSSSANLDNPADWLDQQTQWDGIRNLTIGDYTFLCNPDVKPATWAKEVQRPYECLVTVGAASYGSTYIIDFATENSGQSTRWQVDELQPPGSQTYDIQSPTYAGETTVTNWNGTGLTFRLKIDARAWLAYSGKRYAHTFTPYVTLLTPGNSTAPFPSSIYVVVSGLGWYVRVSKQSTSRVYANLGTAQFTTPSDPSGGGADVSTIVSGLVSSVQALGNGFTVQSTGNVLRIQNTSLSQDFVVSARGGTNGQGLEAYKYSVNDISELPQECWKDYQMTVRNTSDNEVDDYYVKFTPDVEDADVPGPGYWRETVKDVDTGGLVDASMPHVLVRQEDGSFHMSSLNESQHPDNWADRSVGDKESNPHPSFTDEGNFIYNMFMYKNRLGFVTKDAVIMSQVGDYFNFYNTSGVTISDADPVDLSVSDVKPVKLTSAISTTSGAILFGNQAQFRLSSPEATFGPKDANLDKISNYNYDSDALPVQTGVSVMYPTDMGSYSNVYEMSTESIKGEPVIEDSSRVIPRLLPAGLKWSCSSINNDMVFFGDRSNTVYVFRFFNEGQERKVAGWTRWTFPDNVLDMAAYNDTLYFVFYNPTTKVTTLARSYVTDREGSQITGGEFSYSPRVDKMISSDRNTLLSKGVLVDRKQYWTFASGYHNFSDATPTAITVIYTDNTNGDYQFLTVGADREFYTDEGRPFVVGLTYNMNITLPNFFVKQDGRADRVSDVMVQGVYFDMYQSSGLGVFVNTKGYDPYAGYLTAIDADAYDADAVALRVSNTEYLGLCAPGSQTFVSIDSANPYPSGVTSYTFQGIYNKRGYDTIR